MELLCPDCNSEHWLAFDGVRVCMTCGASMELSEIEFDCACGCAGDASLCVYAETCPYCSAKYYAAIGHTDCPAAK
jgi:hypothetical protein